MVQVYLLTILTALISCQGGTASVFQWFWNKDTDDTTVLVADGVPLVSIPYESMTEDEKFLQEAAKFTDIQIASPLETCQHKVIMKIKTSCSDMTEEQLAKLSVNLLNCQSAVEGRKMFPCTEEMSLKQCTTDMDADMWNAYHLMSNRARAVCYAARSTHFRGLTELTVNKLMQAAHTQIKTLSSLKENQDRLEEQTIDALSSLTKGSNALLEQQQHLKNAQILAHNIVATNLRELSNEKALIRAGHTQLAAMADDIKKRLEEANENLAQQAIERGENHKEILQDLVNIQEQAQLIWDKIESSTNRIFEQHEEALMQYEQTLDRLKQINDTIQYICNMTNIMRAEVDDKLNWITSYIGDTGEQMYRMYRIGSHIIYLLLAMVIAAFLHAPLLTRVTILGLVPLNLVSYLKHGMDASLDFTSMTVLIFFITLMHFVMVGIQRTFGPKPKIREPQPVQVMNQNGYANGTAQDYTSSSYTNLKSSKPFFVPLYLKVQKNIREFYNFVCYQINRFIWKCNSLMQSMVFWNKQSSPQREELSCSYIPLKRTREDFVDRFYNHEEDFPSMSEDITDFEQSNVMDERNESIDDLDKLIDANDLRRRIRRVEANSRSVTPSFGVPKILCSGITRSGNKCRRFAMHGQYRCHRHITGHSVIGD